MRMVDLNVLLYAVNANSFHHAAASRWLDAALNSSNTVAMPWVVLLGFIRLTTSRQVFETPLDVNVAIETVNEWINRPNVFVLGPGEHHWAILARLLSRTGSAGNLTTDAHIAALAIEHGCVLYSTDSDFARFSEVEWVNPLAEAEQ